MRAALALLLWLLAGPALADGAGRMATGVVMAPAAAKGGGVPNCAASTAFLARTSGLNGAHTNAYNALICGMVTDGTWCGSLFDAIYILATQDSATALLNLCSASFNLTANGAPSFTSDAGYTGVDSSITVWLDPGAALNTYTNYTLNSAHYSAWSFTNAASTAGGGNVMGAENSGFVDISNMNIKYSDGNAYCDINDVGDDPGVANANATGWYVCDRTNSTTSTMYRNASVISNPNRGSTAISSSHLEILASSVGTTSFGGSALQVAAATVGAHLSGAQITSVYSRICTFLTTVHGSC